MTDRSCNGPRNYTNACIHSFTERTDYTPDESNVITDGSSIERICFVDTIGDLERVLNLIGQGKDPSLNGVIIRLTDDLTFVSNGGKEWNPGHEGYGQGYFSNVRFTIDGDGHSITGLNGALLPSTHADVDIEIINLTLVGSESSEKDGIGLGTVHSAGAFINEVASVNCSATITIENCSVESSNIGGKNTKFTGGFIGWIDGETTVSIIDSSVEGTEITAYGSVGGVVGHAAGAVKVESTAVSGNTIITIGKAEAGVSTEGPDKNKIGTVFGTVNCDGCIIQDCTVSDNTVKYGDKTLGQEYYGRFAASPGNKLTIDGSSITYENSDINSRP